MRLALVSFLASDNLKLPGILFSPDKPTNVAAVWLHGMGDNGIFYNPARMNALGKALTDRGIALFAFNNRGAHNAKQLYIVNQATPNEDQPYQAGTHYERIADSVYDIEGAAQYLQAQGFQTLYLIGHSSGANKICAYHVRAKQNPFAKYVLAGPGDDTGDSFEELGAKKFWAALQYAAKATTSGDGEHIMPKYSGMYPFSAQATWDILNPDGAYNTFPYYEYIHERLGQKRLFDEYQQLDRPTLVIIGDNDQYTLSAGGPQAVQDIFMKHTSNARLKQTDFQLVHDADHGFHGAEDRFANQVADWLADV